jgi:D-alanine-D-alanine ligase
LNSHDDGLGLPVLLLFNLDPAWPQADAESALQEAAALETGLVKGGHAVHLVLVRTPELLSYLRGFRPEEVIVFNACEELPGVVRSEALVAQTLERLGFVYSGSRAEVLSRSWDKARVRRFLARCGLPVPYWRVYERAEVDGWERFPAIVKPALEHCSVGLSPEAVVFSRAELQRRVRYVHETFRQPALVEDFVDGREFHVSLLGNDELEILPIAEMDFGAFDDPRERICSYESKFCPGSKPYEQIEVRVPALLTLEEQKRLEEIARAVYRAFGCRDYARLDLRLRDGVFYVLDVNPNPDISPETSLAEAARVAGYPYEVVLSRLVRLVARRHPVLGLQ